MKRYISNRTYTLPKFIRTKTFAIICTYNFIKKDLLFHFILIIFNLDPLNRDLDYPSFALVLQWQLKMPLRLHGVRMAHLVISNSLCENTKDTYHFLQKDPVLTESSTAQVAQIAMPHLVCVETVETEDCE
jgi:hypothetical protein